MVAVRASGRRMAPWPGETIHTDAHRVASGPGRPRLMERGGQPVCPCRRALPERPAGCAVCYRNGCWQSWRPGVWCPGCRSRSAPASHVILPRIASRTFGRFFRSRSARLRLPLWHAGGRSVFPSPLALRVCSPGSRLQRCRPRVLLTRSFSCRSQAPHFPGLWRSAKSGSEATAS